MSNGLRWMCGGNHMVGMLLSLYTCLVMLHLEWLWNNWHSKCVTFHKHSMQDIGVSDAVFLYVLYDLQINHREL